MASINLQGDTSGSISISAPSVAGSNTLTLPATTQTLATQNALGVRNLIINGDMRIAQRATSATGLTSSGYYTVDRYNLGYTASGSVDITQSTDVPTGQGFANSVKIDVASSTTPTGTQACNFQQKFEGQNLQHLKKGTSSAESLTVSFWVKSNKTGIYYIEFYDADNTRSISQAYTINVADTWEKKTLTFVGDTSGAFDNDNNLSLTLFFFLSAGPDFSSGTHNSSWGSATTANRLDSDQVNFLDSTSNYINITGVQLEVGDTATPFEHRPYDMELARCQRYYVKWLVPTNTGIGATTWATAVSTTLADGVIFLPTTMRTASPSLTVNSLQYYISTTSGTGSSGTWSLAYATNDKVKVIRYTHGSGVFTAGTAIAFTGNGASGYLALDGEL